MPIIRGVDQGVYREGRTCIPTRRLRGYQEETAPEPSSGKPMLPRGRANSEVPARPGGAPVLLVALAVPCSSAAPAAAPAPPSPAAEFAAACCCCCCLSFIVANRGISTTPTKVEASWW